MLIALVHLFHLNVCEMTNRGISDSRLSSERALKNAPDAAAVHSKDTRRKVLEVLGESVLVTETERGPI